MKRAVLVPLPDHDFDVTEVAVPWRLLTDAGYEVRFATESGATPACDPLLITGVVLGQLGADAEAIRHYRAMEVTEAFKEPIRWDAIRDDDYAGMFLPGGHAPGMRQYLGSDTLRAKVASFFRTGRPVGAICHGVLVLARAIDPTTGRSLLHDRRTTCLPKYMERTAYFLTFWKLGRYYRTYPAYVEDEVREALAQPTQFERGPRTLTKRGTATDDTGAFVVEDGAYVSGRWPGDAYLVAKRFIAKLESTGVARSGSVAAE